MMKADVSVNHPQLKQGARGCLLTLEKHATCNPINLGYGKATTIKEVAQTILKATGYENAKIKFDSSKPTTIPFRLLDTSKARRILGFEPKVSLEEGIKDTVKWYVEEKKGKV